MSKQAHLQEPATDHSSGPSSEGDGRLAVYTCVCGGVRERQRPAAVPVRRGGLGRADLRRRLRQPPRAGRQARGPSAASRFKTYSSSPLLPVPLPSPPPRLTPPVLPVSLATHARCSTSRPTRTWGSSAPAATGPASCRTPTTSPWTTSKSTSPTDPTTASA